MFMRRIRVPFDAEGDPSLAKIDRIRAEHVAAPTAESVDVVLAQRDAVQVFGAGDQAGRDVVFFAPGPEQYLQQGD